ncbi:MAG: hypothetical protein DSZ05_01005 [Sulfurospirillum sp.]|nr:MAG: hypothetical protein DSZ05_01005 [Sulfurospirillum sp.]
MGLKENVEAIKQELSTEEQFLESVIKAEGFFKKYKKLLIALGTLLVVGFLAYAAMEYIKNRDLQQANQALALLQSNPEDQAALDTLKSKKPELYELYIFSQAVKSSDVAKLQKVEKELKDPVLKDLATFQSAALSQDSEGLQGYAEKQGAMLREVSILDDAFLLFEEGKNKEAREMLKQIPVTSSLYQVVQNFMHYQK